jgi:hypothetical protein
MFFLVFSGKGCLKFAVQCSDLNSLICALFNKFMEFYVLFFYGTNLYKLMRIKPPNDIEANNILTELLLGSLGNRRPIYANNKYMEIQAYDKSGFKLPETNLVLM